MRAGANAYARARAHAHTHTHAHAHTPQRIGPMLLTSTGISDGSGEGGGGLMAKLQQKYAKDLNVTLGCDFIEALKFVEEDERDISLYLIDR